MKIAICSSMVFSEKMIDVQRQLIEMGHEAFVSIFTNAYIGKTEQEKEQITIYHKKEKDAIREFWNIIKACDAILVLNYTRRGIENYIGGNTFLEMGFAHVLNKRIFFMNPIPDVQLYKSEIEAMKPEIIYEDLAKVGMAMTHRFSESLTQISTMTPINSNLQSQLKALETIVLKNSVLKAILERTPDLSLPNWYLGAGCIAQTVWNYFSAHDLLDNINDADLVYFDDSDLSSEGEAHKTELAQKLFSDVPIHVDLKNQARVHLWYEGHFGYPIQPYRSVEEAINSWPTTATSVAVKYDNREEFTVYAPYGLNDLFSMIVRPNKLQITEEIYMGKVNRWKACWSDLRIIPW